MGVNLSGCYVFVIRQISSAWYAVMGRRMPFIFGKERGVCKIQLGFFYCLISCLLLLNTKCAWQNAWRGWNGLDTTISFDGTVLRSVNIPFSWIWRRYNGNCCSSHLSQYNWKSSSPEHHVRHRISCMKGITNNLLSISFMDLPSIELSRFFTPGK